MSFVYSNNEIEKMKNKHKKEIQKLKLNQKKEFDRLIKSGGEIFTKEQFKTSLKKIKKFLNIHPKQHEINFLNMKISLLEYLKTKMDNNKNFLRNDIKNIETVKEKYQRNIDQIVLGKNNINNNKSNNINNNILDINAIKNLLTKIKNSYHEKCNISIRKCQLNKFQLYRYCHKITLTNNIFKDLESFFLRKKNEHKIKVIKYLFESNKKINIKNKDLINISDDTLEIAYYRKDLPKNNFFDISFFYYDNEIKIRYDYLATLKTKMNSNNNKGYKNIYSYVPKSKRYKNLTFSQKLHQRFIEEGIR